MKAGLAFALLGVFGLMLQGSAAIWIPARFLPDVGLLVVVALAACVRSAMLGVCLAALLGYATDLLSGTLLGQQALLLLGAYGAARALSSSFNLRGPLSLAVFALLLSAAHAAMLHVLVASFSREGLAIPDPVEDVVVHAVATALGAPVVVALVSRAAAWLGDDDSGRPVRLEPRTLPL